MDGSLLGCQAVDKTYSIIAYRSRQSLLFRENHEKTRCFWEETPGAQALLAVTVWTSRHQKQHQRLVRWERNQPRG